MNSAVNFLSLGFMVGYLGYCKRVEPKVEREETEPPKIAGAEPSETEEYFPEVPSRLFWTELKAMLSEKLNATEFTSTIR